MAAGQPTEIYPSDATLDALEGTTDTATGLEYIPKGTGPASTPSLIHRLTRWFNRVASQWGSSSELRVVKVTTTSIGVRPGYFRLADVDYYYPGETSIAVSTSADTYYVYADADSDDGGSGTVNVVTDATGWPADPSTYIPLAEIVVASSVISTITDVRNRVRLGTQSVAAAAGTGTDQTAWIIDQDNAGAGASSELRFNRGSTANDAAIRWDETNDKLVSLADRDGNTLATHQALILESTQATGTAPLVVASTTKVANLNADKVDGIDVTAPAAANGVAFATSTAAVEFTAAPTAADVLVADGSGVPTFAALGSASGVQAYDADLAAVAGVSSNGLIARTGAGTAAARTITSGDSVVGVTNGDGVSGNPTLAIAGMTQYGVIVGASGGTIASLAVPSDNTVLAGRSGNTPTFRKIVNADVDTGAEISGAKLLANSVAPERLYNEETNGQFLRSGISPSVIWAYLHWTNSIAESHEFDLAHNETVTTNEGVTSKPTYTLYTAIKGLCVSFVVQDSDGLRVQAAAGDTIRIAGTASAAAGYIESTTIGDSVTLVAINTTEWVAISVVHEAGWSFGP